MSNDLRRELTTATRSLECAGVASPQHDAAALLAWVLGLPKNRLMTRSSLDASAVAAYRQAIRRRAAREPLQHITGTAAFRYLDLEVGPGVFTPRSETEVMAGVAVDELNRLVMSGVATPFAVDLCTGSGAVAIAMATEVPVAKVVGVELSAAAHRFALRNALGSGVDMRLGDIAVAVDDLAGAVHVVVANPPYIPLAAYEHVETEARDFDPPLALWSGVDGLDMIALVADVAARLLVAEGLVACEHADVQGEAALALFAATGNWTSLRDHRDLAGRPRFVTARRVARGSRSAGTMSS
jgi:release factor glutamine methyltransferase